MGDLISVGATFPELESSISPTISPINASSPNNRKIKGEQVLTSGTAASCDGAAITLLT